MNLVAHLWNCYRYLLHTIQKLQMCRNYTFFLYFLVLFLPIISIETWDINIYYSVLRQYVAIHNRFYEIYLIVCFFWQNPFFKQVCILSSLFVYQTHKRSFIENKEYGIIKGENRSNCPKVDKVTHRLHKSSLMVLTEL